MLGATLQHHLSKKPEKYKNTVESLRENTYVDNLMKTESDITELEGFKNEATEIFEDAKFPVHKWESNVKELDHKRNPTKILGHKWDKREDTIEIVANPAKEEIISDETSDVYYTNILNDWTKWRNQLRSVKIPRSLSRERFQSPRPCICIWLPTQFKEHK